MTYELAKQLKDAGFPMSSNPCKRCAPYFEGNLGCPTLSELISAVGERFGELNHYRNSGDWEAQAKTDWMGSGSMPEIVVARLWLILNK